MSPLPFLGFQIFPRGWQLRLMAKDMARAASGVVFMFYLVLISDQALEFPHSSQSCYNAPLYTNTPFVTLLIYMRVSGWSANGLRFGVVEDGVQGDYAWGCDGEEWGRTDSSISLFFIN